MSSIDPTQEGRQGKVIHVGMAAFYASVEQHNDPEQRGKSAAVVLRRPVVGYGGIECG